MSADVIPLYLRSAAEERERDQIIEAARRLAAKLREHRSKGWNRIAVGAGDELLVAVYGDAEVSS